MWQLLRDKLIEGEKLYIPYFNIFKPYNNKWTRPLSKDLRNKIKNKKHAWNRFIKTKNPASLLEYKKLSNSIRHQTRLI